MGEVVKNGVGATARPADDGYLLLQTETNTAHVSGRLNFVAASMMAGKLLLLVFHLVYSFHILFRSLDKFSVFREEYSLRPLQRSVHRLSR